MANSVVFWVLIEGVGLAAVGRLAVKAGLEKKYFFVIKLSAAKQQMV